MNTQKHLQAIKDKCQELLAIAEKRTAGNWIHATDLGQVGSIECGIEVIAMTQEHVSLAGNRRGQVERRNHNAAFIASCAGAAEAGWRATIAAIDCYLFHRKSNQGGWQGDCNARERMKDEIIAAWPPELLQKS
jgi:hypothetical protein